MSTAEGRINNRVILQEFIYRRPSENTLKRILYGLGVRKTLSPNMTQCTIEAEWRKGNDKEYAAKATIELWNLKPIGKKKIEEVVYLFAKSSSVKISEILPL